MAYAVRPTKSARATGRRLFADGALAWDEGGVILNEQHARAQPIMRFTPTVEGREVRIDAPLPDTQRGRDAATMIRNGTMTRAEQSSSARPRKAAGPVCARFAPQRLMGAALVDSIRATRATLEVRERRQAQGGCPDMAVATLSPWPTSSAAVALTAAARTCLGDSTWRLTDESDAGQRLGSSVAAALVERYAPGRTPA